MPHVEPGDLKAVLKRLEEVLDDNARAAAQLSM
jgi:hypothetical protein